MPIDYKQYPDDWKEIRARILKRADDKCEICGVNNYEIGYRDKRGRFFTSKEVWYIGESMRSHVRDELFDFPLKSIKIILTVAHLKHGHYEDDADLLCCCQSCHLKIDLQYKLKKRKIEKDKYQLELEEV